ncbi:MAG TPA: bacillithiol biosynthesis deacetylase BshB1 [Bacteroidota bacterium]|nr:bacillithiol biosynthesis deacetylase BshB1 [Bacteroidota bacterium]
MHVDILAVGAHPDDIELSCGATIARMVQLGHSAAIADLTQGELGTRGTKEIRSREAEEAAGILGVKTRRNLKIADGNIEVSQTNLHKVIALIRELRPSMMIIPHSFDRHPDHTHAHRLCREAWFYSGLSKISTKHEETDQEPHRPDVWFEFMQWHEFTPSFIIDVTDSWETKMKAVRAHSSQFFDPHSKEPETRLSKPDFLELVDVRGRAYGRRIGKKFGEPFLSPVPIGVADMFSLTFTRG